MILRHAAKALVLSSSFPLSLLYTALCPLPARAQVSVPGIKEPTDTTWAGVYDRTLPGVVYILSEGLCSGVFVADDLVLTAWHCVIGSRTLRVGHDKETRRKGRYEFESGVVVAAADVKNDLAVLRLPRKHAGKVLRIAPADYAYRAGQEIATIGHPVGLSPMSPTGLSETQLNILTRGPIAKVNDDLIIADLLVLPGNSGGAVIDASGDVVGVVSARHRDGDLGYFVPVAKIQAVVARARASKREVPRRPFFGEGALGVHGSFEADRYARKLYSSSQNIYTIAPSLTVLGTVRATYSTRAGPQRVNKRQWDVTFLYDVEVSRLLDVELGLGGGQVFYSHESTGHSKQSALVKAVIGVAGAQAVFAFPTEDLAAPTFSVGLDLLGLF